MPRSPLLQELPHHSHNHDDGSVVSSSTNSSRSYVRRRSTKKRSKEKLRHGKGSCSNDSSVKNEKRSKDNHSFRRKRRTSSCESETSVRSDVRTARRKNTRDSRSPRRKSPARSRSRSSKRHGEDRGRYDRNDRRARARFLDDWQGSARFRPGIRHTSPRNGYSYTRWNAEERVRLNPPPSVCLGVFGMSAGTNDDHLRTAFSKHGNIRDIQIIRHPITGISRGFGFVNFFELGDAKKARDALNGAFLMGNELRVDYSISKGPRGSASRQNDRN